MVIARTIFLLKKQSHQLYYNQSPHLSVFEALIYVNYIYSFIHSEVYTLHVFHTLPACTYVWYNAQILPVASWSIFFIKKTCNKLNWPSLRYFIRKMNVVLARWKVRCPDGHKSLLLFFRICFFQIKLSLIIYLTSVTLHFLVCFVSSPWYLWIPLFYAADLLCQLSTCAPHSRRSPEIAGILMNTSTTICTHTSRFKQIR